MDVSLKEAQDKLEELLDRAAAGEEVVVTRAGHPPVRFVPDPVVPRPRFRRDVIDEIVRHAMAEALPGPDAARSQDFLYDENGLPH